MPAASTGRPTILECMQMERARRLLGELFNYFYIFPHFHVGYDFRTFMCHVLLRVIVRKLDEQKKSIRYIFGTMFLFLVVKCRSYPLLHQLLIAVLLYPVSLLIVSLLSTSG